MFVCISVWVFLSLVSVCVRVCVRVCVCVCVRESERGGEGEREMVDLSEARLRIEWGKHFRIAIWQSRVRVYFQRETA